MDKFPSIPHLSFSPQINDDDIVVPDSKMILAGATEIVIHEKLDGGNCCVFAGNVYARTHKHPTKHPWFDTIKMMVKSQPLFYESPYFDELMIFGENMTATHSIAYSGLISYFYIFSVFNIKTKTWLSIDETKQIANTLHLPTAPLLFRGTFESLNAMKKWMESAIHQPSKLGSPDREGFVVRTSAAIHCGKFGESIAKYVRKGHIQTDQNWTKTWKKAKLVAIEKSLEYYPQPMDESATSAQPTCTQVTSRKQSMKGRKKKKVKVAASLKTSLIICVGLPGSGKSTFSEHLCDERSEWSRCGTDLVKAESAALGIKRKRNADVVFDFVARQIKQRHKVVVENCNVTKRKRQELLDCAFKPKDAVCVYFDVSVEECKKRAATRRGHDTKKLFDSSRGFKIIDSFAKQLEKPDTKEGFKQVIVVRNNEDIDRLLSRLGVRKSIDTLFNDKNEVNDENVEEEKERDETFVKSTVTPNRRKRNMEKRDRNLYYAPKAKSRFAMSTKMLCKKLKLEIDDIVSVFVIGSRVWGSATSKSDWNVIIITESDGHVKKQKVGNVDANILSKQEWNEKLKSHYYLCWLTLFLPQDAIWKNESDATRFNLKQFVNALKKEIERDCKKIKIFYEKNKVIKVQRTFRHCLRMIMVSKQIAVLILGMFRGMDVIDLSQHSFIGAIRFDEIEESVDVEIGKLSDLPSSSITTWTEPLRQAYKECVDMLDM